MIADVKAVVGDTPYMKVPQAEQITKLIKDNGLQDVLELGVMHGVSTCYLADVAKHVVAIDLVKPAGEDRPAEKFLTQLGLRDKVDLFYEPTSYTWRLMKMLEEDPTPRFDLVYIDGAHNWFTDGFAFFLADKLLRPGGWIVFDDIPWSYASSPTLREQPFVQAMPEDERTTQQIRKVFDLLVKTHPSYDHFQIDGQWGYAHKATTVTTGEIRTVVIKEIVELHRGLGYLFSKAGKLVRSR